MVLVFEPTTFITRVSSHNHYTMPEISTVFSNTTRVTLEDLLPNTLSVD